VTLWGLWGWAGQLLYASGELREARGLDRKGKEALGSGRLLVSCEEISGAFWDTKWGRDMREELDHKPFRKCVPASPSSLAKTLAGHSCQLAMHLSIFACHEQLVMQCGEKNT